MEAYQFAEQRRYMLHNANTVWILRRLELRFETVVDLYVDALALPAYP